MTYDALISELPLPLDTEGGDLDVLAVAVAVEDAFHIVLADDEITLGELGTAEAVHHLLERHLGAG